MLTFSGEVFILNQEQWQCSFPPIQNCSLTYFVSITGSVSRGLADIAKMITFNPASENSQRSPMGFCCCPSCVCSPLSLCCAECGVCLHGGVWLHRKRAVGRDERQISSRLYLTSDEIGRNLSHSVCQPPAQGKESNDSPHLVGLHWSEIGPSTYGPLSHLFPVIFIPFSFFPVWTQKFMGLFSYCLKRDNLRIRALGVGPATVN